MKKRLLSIICILAMTLSLFACKNPPGETTSSITDPEESTEAATAETTEPVTEPSSVSPTPSGEDDPEHPVTMHYLKRSADLSEERKEALKSYAQLLVYAEDVQDLSSISKEVKKNWEYWEDSNTNIKVLNLIWEDEYQFVVCISRSVNKGYDSVPRHHIIQFTKSVDGWFVKKDLFSDNEFNDLEPQAQRTELLAELIQDARMKTPLTEDALEEAKIAAIELNMSALTLRMSDYEKGIYREYLDAIYDPDWEAQWLPRLMALDESLLDGQLVLLWVQFSALLNGADAKTVQGIDSSAIEGMYRPETYGWTFILRKNDANWTAEMTGSRIEPDPPMSTLDPDAPKKEITLGQEIPYSGPACALTEAQAEILLRYSGLLVNEWDPSELTGISEDVRANWGWRYGTKPEAIPGTVLWSDDDLFVILAAYTSMMDENDYWFHLIRFERKDGEWFAEKDIYAPAGLMTGFFDDMTEVLTDLFYRERALHPLTEDDWTAIREAIMERAMMQAPVRAMTPEEQKAYRESLEISYNAEWERQNLPLALFIRDYMNTRYVLAYLSGSGPSEDGTGVNKAWQIHYSKEEGWYAIWVNEGWAPAPADPETLSFTDDDYPKVDGSTSTKPLAKVLQEEFTGAENVEITHSKSHQSYLNLVDKKCDMILAVEPSQDEYAYAAGKGVTLEVEKVTNEGFVFFVNKRNPVESLTLQQIRDIYSGKITNWKEVGGQDAEIVAFQRNPDSGSQTGMLSLVMGDTPMMEPVKGTVADSMSEIVDVISAFDSGEYAIGYSYYYYANTMYLGENVKMIAVEGVKPNNTTIREGRYPLLTAYYAITRKGDASENTLNLIQGILSERGQKAVQRAGYVPVIDVGAYDPENPAASNEKTVSLSDTYTTNPVRVLVKTDTYGGYEYQYAVLTGLSNEAVLQKINDMLHEDAKASLIQGLQHVKQGEQHIQSGVVVTANFNNVLSLYSLNIFHKQNVSHFSIKIGTNVRLDTGERLTLQDLFKTDTKGKDIFNADFYGEVIFKAKTFGYASIYNYAEDWILSLIQDYNNGADFNFYFTPREVCLLDLLNQTNSDRWLDLWFTYCMEEVTIYHKYEELQVSYDGTLPSSSALPALTDHGICAMADCEKTDDYFLDIGFYLPIDTDFPEACIKKAQELYEQYREDVRKELKEKAAQGIYAFYNPLGEVRDPSWEDEEGVCALTITNDYTELSSREELNKLYEDTLKGIRDPHFEYWGRNHFIYAAWPEETHVKTITYYFDEAGNILRTKEGGY